MPGPHEACGHVALRAPLWKGVDTGPGHSQSDTQPDIYLGLLSIPEPGLREAAPIFCSTPSVPSRRVTQAVLSLGKGLGGDLLLGCLLTFASTPETRAHETPSKAQDPRL